MKAWAADQKVGDSMIKMFGDPRSELTEALGLVLDHPGPMSVLGSPRCKRFSMYIDDGVIKTINVAEAEDDPAGDDNPTSTFVEKMLEDIPDPVGGVGEPAVKVGDMIPDVSLDSGFPPEKVNLREFTKGKRVVLVGLPGAFTPT
jgi:peroxiredoxin